MVMMEVMMVEQVVVVMEVEVKICEQPLKLKINLYSTGGAKGGNFSPGKVGSELAQSHHSPA